MLELGYCYPYDSNIFWDGRNTELSKHWFNICTFSYDEFKDENYASFFISNISNISNMPNYINIVLYPQILKLYEMDDTILCIIKTSWLKIFQRKYRNYYNKKLNYYKNPKNLLKRQIFG
jgi:hypothetical protein